MKIKLVLASMLCASAFAHDAGEGAVKERMMSMEAVGDANKPLTAISRGRADFDLATVQASAKVLAENSGQYFADLFPVGSMDPESAAKTEIWEDWETFYQYSMDLNSAAVALSEITSEDEFNAAYSAVGDTCMGCHRKFRARR
jgi:cytochrome c556